MQLLGSHVWLLRGLEALARMGPLVEQQLVSSSERCSGFLRAGEVNHNQQYSVSISLCSSPMHACSS